MFFDCQFFSSTSLNVLVGELLSQRSKKYTLPLYVIFLSLMIKIDGPELASVE
jgi:hypothetical protein